MKTLRIAVIPGDGVGPEVIGSGTRVLTAVAAKHGLSLGYTFLDWGSEAYLRTGHYIPPGGLQLLREHDAIYFGAVGSRNVPDHISLRSLRVAICKGLKLEVCERPARILRGIESPLRVSNPQALDWYFVRQNVDGEYSGIGRRQEGLGIDEAVFEVQSISRIAEYAFRKAQSRSCRLAYVTKSNALPHGMVVWDETIEAVARQFPTVKHERVLTDAFAYRMVKQPLSIDVVLGSNLHADILTDLSAAVMGSLGLAPSSNIDPRHESPPMFEPVHGSAFDIVGKGIANPIGAIWSGALMLAYLGASEAADRIVGAIEHVCAARIFTPDLGGSATSEQITVALLEAL